jgi:hypothetical protein
MTDPCFVCEMRKYPLEKLLDEDFLRERKNEFYPDEEYGEFAQVCKDCNAALIEYYYK